MTAAQRDSEDSPRQALAGALGWLDYLAATPSEATTREAAADPDGGPVAEPAQPAGPEWIDANVFEFLRAAGAHPAVNDRVFHVLTLMALTCRGTSGVDAVVNVDDLAAALRVSERTVWRRLDPVLGTWLLQTTKPTTGTAGRRGRRARYRLRVPAESCVTDERERDTRLPEVVCHPEQSRVTFSAESCDTTERERGTGIPFVSTTSDGPSTAELRDAARRAGHDPTAWTDETISKANQQITASAQPWDEIDPADVLTAIATEHTVRNLPGLIKAMTPHDIADHAKRGKQVRQRQERRGRDAAEVANRRCPHGVINGLRAGQCVACDRTLEEATRG